MAIRVVQGLIDPARFGRSTPASDQSKPVSQTSTSTAFQQQIVGAQSAVISATKAFAALSSDAVALQVRASGRSGVDGDKLRDSAKAEQVAERVSEAVRSRGDGSADPHLNLTPSTAREHFSG
jgi:hypothetical protein